jgi:hypothetical protein
MSRTIMLARTSSNLTDRMLREQDVRESAYRILVGKPEAKNDYAGEDQQQFSRPDVKGTGCERECIQNISRKPWNENTTLEIKV